MASITLHSMSSIEEGMLSFVVTSLVLASNVVWRRYSNLLRCVVGRQGFDNAPCKRDASMSSLWAIRTGWVPGGGKRSSSGICCGWSCSRTPEIHERILRWVER